VPSPTEAPSVGVGSVIPLAVVSVGDAYALVGSELSVGSEPPVSEELESSVASLLSPPLSSLPLSSFWALYHRMY
jgi:hypothetical protein